MTTGYESGPVMVESLSSAEIIINSSSDSSRGRIPINSDSRPKMLEEQLISSAEEITCKQTFLR